MDTPHEAIAVLVANALDDIEAGRMDVATALRTVAEQASRLKPSPAPLAGLPPFWAAAV